MSLPSVMSLTKVPAIFLTGLAFNVSLSPLPTLAMGKGGRVMKDGLSVESQDVIVGRARWAPAASELPVRQMPTLHLKKSLSHCDVLIVP